MQLRRFDRLQGFCDRAQDYLLQYEDDRPLLLDWFKAFVTEIGEVVSEPPERMVETGLKRQSVHLWDDGTPVSWASGSQSLPTAAIASSNEFESQSNNFNSHYDSYRTETLFGTGCAAIAEAERHDLGTPRDWQI